MKQYYQKSEVSDSNKHRYLQCGHFLPSNTCKRGLCNWYRSWALLDYLRIHLYSQYFILITGIFYDYKLITITLTVLDLVDVLWIVVNSNFKENIMGRYILHY